MTAYCLLIYDATVFKIKFRFGLRFKVIIAGWISKEMDTKAESNNDNLILICSDYQYYKCRPGINFTLNKKEQLF